MSLLVVIDIDGTIAHAGRRFTEAGPEPSRDDRAAYLEWVGKVQNVDTLMQDKPVAGMMKLLSYIPQSRAVYLTSRESRWREVTANWLKEHGFKLFPLYMRPDSNWQSAVEFKEAIIKEARLPGEDVILIDDDEHDALRTMCAKNGWTFLKACSGGQRYKHEG